SERDGIQSACEAKGFTCHVQTSELGELMAEADLAVGAGGITTWERCCLGLPALVFPAAENQIQQSVDAAAHGCIYVPDLKDEGDLTSLIERHTRALMDNSNLRSFMSRRGMELVDGEGARRVIRQIGGYDIRLREANRDDSAKLFEWRNHPSVRAVSRNREPL